MYGPELIAYIQDLERKGYAPQQIEQYLVNQGYTPADATDAVNRTLYQATPNQQQYAATSGKKSSPLDAFIALVKNNLVLVVVIGIILVVLAVGLLLIRNASAKGDDSIESSPDVQAAAENNNNNNNNNNQQTIADTQQRQQQEKDEEPACAAFSAQLEMCASFTCDFVDSYSGDTMQRTVVGLEGDGCRYEETMPNNGQMVCIFPATSLPVYAQYYRDLILTGKTKSAYTVDGRVVENPVSDALSSGVCTLAGY